MNKITTVFAWGNKLTSLNLSGKTKLTGLYCQSNQLTSLNVSGASKLQSLYCYDNQLTSLNVSGCSALKTLYCFWNNISGSGMTTLVGSLPTRTASNPGTLRVIYSNYENNTMTADQITTAINKNWLPKKYDGSSWVDLTATQRGDVNGDGVVNILDVTFLINQLLSGDANSNANADVDGNGLKNIADVTCLVGMLLTGSN